MYYKFQNPQITQLLSDDFITNPIYEVADLKENYKDFKKYFTNIEETIANDVANKDSFEVNKGWINFYPQNKNNEMHTHEDAEFIKSNSSHVLIQVLETGDIPENLIIEELDGTMVSVPIVTGDIIIFHISVPHGLYTTLNKLRILLLGIRFTYNNTIGSSLEELTF